MPRRFFLFATIALFPSLSVRAADPAPIVVIKKAIKAAGWGKATGEFMTWKDKGKLSFNDQKMDYTAEWKVDGNTGRYRMDVKMDVGGQKIEMSHTFDGEKAFESMGPMKQDVTGVKLEYTKGSGHLFRISSLKSLLTDDKFKLTSVPGKDVEGKATTAVNVEFPKRSTITLFFEKETGLYVKSEGMVMNEFENWKEVLDESYYGGWKDVGGGMKNFTTLKVVRGGKPMIESAMSDFVMSDKPDWAKTAFEKP